jgi:hypothetical protein
MLDVCFINTLPVIQDFPRERHAPAWLLGAGLEPGVPRGVLAQELLNIYMGKRIP